MMYTTLIHARYGDSQQGQITLAEPPHLATGNHTARRGGTGHVHKTREEKGRERPRERQQKEDRHRNKHRRQGDRAEKGRRREQGEEEKAKEPLSRYTTHAAP